MQFFKIIYDIIIYNAIFFMCRLALEPLQPPLCQFYPRNSKGKKFAVLQPKAEHLRLSQDSRCRDVKKKTQNPEALDKDHRSVTCPGNPLVRRSMAVSGFRLGSACQTRLKGEVLLLLPTRRLSWAKNSAIMRVLVEEMLSLAVYSYPLLTRKPRQ